MYSDLPDFDTMMAMHRDNPEELERLRAELTGEVLKQAPDEIKRRLKGLQFRINMELRKAKTPQARCIKMSSMMHDAFSELNHRLNHFGDDQDEEPTRPAQIIKFRPRQKIEEF